MTFQRIIVIALVSAVGAKFNLSLGVHFKPVFGQLSGALEISTTGVAVLSRSALMNALLVVDQSKPLLKGLWAHVAPKFSFL